ncbi:MAG: hypothetical protein AB7D36_10280 [Oscillospiraceae bacterium]
MAKKKYDYLQGLDDATTDWGTVMGDMMDSGASAQDVSYALGRRIKKATNPETPDLAQYAYDDKSQTAIDYIANYNKANTDYEKALDDTLTDYLKRDPFSYDPEDDPLYSSYKKQYLREGQRATEDTLGNYAAMTGGIPSTAAVNAATQAGDYYNAQLNDALPQLQQLAYSMYSDDRSNDLSKISMLQSLNDSVNNRAESEKEWDYNVAQDDYTKAQNATESAKNELDSILAAGGTPSESLIAAANVSDDYVPAMQAYYQSQNTPNVVYSSSGNGGNGGDDNNGGDPDYDGLFEAAKNSSNPQNFIASNYKKYGFTSSAGLYAQYQDEYGYNLSAVSKSAKEIEYDLVKFYSNDTDRLHHINQELDSGVINDNDYKYLLDRFGLL